ncbi:hypothetical protein C8J27_104159 [Rhodobacter aestuarii]|uniref:Alpha/beta hydrolase family protein n=1 Tax=Rhodobacter aestuarii TaxID=453582 RepID=A0A1N7KX87_9RHOB|nr:lysophospholipase [Rhodobacter aestuarii]PTV95523.1 hypothetical protein C8J27_104159 [Rhodobacter aestuarii]SIS66096.1 hypothetical protein SAMN05421580_10395 [Rhodobacter aestuarii]
MSQLFSILRTTLAAYKEATLCRLVGRWRPKPPAAPSYNYSSETFTVERFGDCQKGSYIEVYRPDTPWRDSQGRMRAVIFLHGFVLGASQIYRAHLEHLVKQGTTVFFPNFQTGFCSFPDTGLMTLAELLDEVIGEGRPSQEKWLQNALESVAGAYARCGFGPGTEVDTYVYGHSLGGLFALSWPYYVQAGGYPAQLMPLQVLTADPIPSGTTTAKAQAPMQLGAALARTQSDVDLQVTGAALTMPVAILHGADDWIVPKEHWQAPFGWIATPHKKMFLSQSDRHGCPGLFANHEQATDDTSFFRPWLATLLLDGVGSVDTLDYAYLWRGLDQVVAQGVRADQLTFDMGQWSDGRAVAPILPYLP